MRIDRVTFTPDLTARAEPLADAVKGEGVIFGLALDKLLQSKAVRQLLLFFVFSEGEHLLLCSAFLWLKGRRDGTLPAGCFESVQQIHVLFFFLFFVSFLGRLLRSTLKIGTVFVPVLFYVCLNDPRRQLCEIPPPSPQSRACFGLGAGYKREYGQALARKTRLYTRPY